jgi:hypothetical protein
MNIAGHRAADLVGEILTLARLDAGALIARPVPVDVTHAVAQAVAAHPDQPITITAAGHATALVDPAHL